jgi:hypothetical protein
MSQKKFKGYIQKHHHHNINLHIIEEILFDTEEEMTEFLMNVPTGEHRFKDHVTPVIEGKFSVKRYKWQDGALFTEVDHFDSLEEAHAHARSSTDEHHLIKVYNDQGEIVHETGAVSSSGTYA